MVAQKSKFYQQECCALNNSTPHRKLQQTIAGLHAPIKLLDPQNTSPSIKRRRTRVHGNQLWQKCLWGTQLALANLENYIPLEISLKYRSTHQNTLSFLTLLLWTQAVSCRPINLATRNCFEISWCSDEHEPQRRGPDADLPKLLFQSVESECCWSMHSAVKAIQRLAFLDGTSLQRLEVCGHGSWKQIPIHLDQTLSQSPRKCWIRVVVKRRSLARFHNHDGDMILGDLWTIFEMCWRQETKPRWKVIRGASNVALERLEATEDLQL